MWFFLFFYFFYTTRFINFLIRPRVVYTIFNYMYIWIINVKFNYSFRCNYAIPRRSVTKSIRALVIIYNLHEHKTARSLSLTSCWLIYNKYAQTHTSCSYKIDNLTVFEIRPNIQLFFASTTWHESIPVYCRRLGWNIITAYVIDVWIVFCTLYFHLVIVILQVESRREYKPNNL